MGRREGAEKRAQKMTAVAGFSPTVRHGGLAAEEWTPRSSDLLQFIASPYSPDNTAIRFADIR